jgi:menaquinone-specific isochorismate synthase
MSTGSTTRLASHDDAPGSLARQIQNLAERVRAVGEVKPGSFVRVEVGVSGLHSGSLHSGSIDSGNLDFLAWLRGAPVGARRYFRDRSTKLEFASVGVATTAAFGAHTSLAQVAVGGSEPRAAAWFVALPFDAARPRDAAWEPFTAVGCVLPAIELRREQETTTLAAHIASDTDRAKLLADLAALVTPCDACVIEPALVRDSDGGGEAEWTRAVRGALERIRSGAMRKLVLARTRRYAASGALDPVAILSRLSSREARGFRFLIEVGAGRAFLGVTPERLVSRSGRIARSEAVAGTRPRGVDGVADRLLGESLLASAKDRREHELVVERVREALASCSVSLRLDPEPRLLRLAYVQHLATRVHAELRAGTNDADLVRLLHPTPAVAGAPVADAIETLRAIEPFDRGLYAGPVGIASRDGAEIAVAIRSARIEGDMLTAFAGAGIVEGSDPAEEWRETGHKLLAFERLAT